MFYFRLRKGCVVVDALLSFYGNIKHSVIFFIGLHMNIRYSYLSKVCNNICSTRDLLCFKILLQYVMIQSNKKRLLCYSYIKVALHITSEHITIELCERLFKGINCTHLHFSILRTIQLCEPKYDMIVILICGKTYQEIYVSPSKVSTKTYRDLSSQLCMICWNRWESLDFTHSFTILQFMAQNNLILWASMISFILYFCTLHKMERDLRFWMPFFLP